MPDSLNNLNLTKKHFSRLRHYFTRNIHRPGGASQTDALDLDLVGCGYIKRVEANPLYATVYYSITAKGEEALYLEKQEEIKRRSPHHELGTRLGKFLRSKGRITWENVQFEVEYEEDGKTVRSKSRPDVFSMMVTYNTDKMSPVVHEVKVRRADFLSDRANERKRENYKLIAEKFYYVCPEGLILPEEVPAGCGLIYEKKSGLFKTIKNSKSSKVLLKPKDFMSLILKNGQFDSIY